ncbi:RNA-directed DNA polymerase from mobile element jockey [Trichonephila clavipes]|nr:RNA-directed DNA polymerase from mobile element jockey [Trichonephila clavipes]
MILFKFPTYLIKIIHSYLDNRTFNVKLNNVLSSQRPILASTPQGSILSPALYNIYTSDFPTDNNMTVCLFADDAALLCSRKTVQEAINLTQNYIFKLELWLTKWRIAINTDKTHAIVFRKTRSHNSPPPLQIYNSTIEWTFQVKYLGLILNDNLTYKPHFEETTKNFGKSTSHSSTSSAGNQNYHSKQAVCLQAIHPPHPPVRLRDLGIRRKCTHR